ncbi:MULTISPECIES: M23 family metallopeptidase [Tenacibaculum]|uniref:M23 family metallopeptidase n=1 Tax=Tenacibaculum TaxID=104267 RepID=UPI001F0A3722|nr:MULTISPECIES: M23 family metallopeptidase [Tenacibaculum]MCH3881216.1 M23 family metallopeptidase [Tenacibaculum aquimarinum]MDO6599190.1 M23 family metallopeptidase [Tenacibaculum sp. 1_MG-2023]
MSKQQKKKGKLKQKLTDKYRLVVLNEDTFEERFSLKLSRLNVFVLGGFFSIFLIALTILLIAFTPLREYIPGYSSTALKKKATQLTFEADSLKMKLAVLENFTNSIKPVLTGEIKPESIDSLRAEAESIVINDEMLSATKEDSLFREKVESKDRFPLSNSTNNKTKIVFFAPVSGTISQDFNATEKHFAIDVVAKTGTPVKAVADGTVIFSEWTTETGYVLTIQHTNNFISVYKHNGNLLKQQGDFVKSGEVISTVGSTGELTTGPHLHFELWNNGYSVNPKNYIDFQ